MTIRASTGLKNAMLGEVGLKAALADGVIRVYSGAQPAAADNAVTGTLLMEITVDAGAFSHGSATNGLEWDTRQMAKSASLLAIRGKVLNCCRRSRVGALLCQPAG